MAEVSEAQAPQEQVAEPDSPQDTSAAAPEPQAPPEQPPIEAKADQEEEQVQGAVASASERPDAEQVTEEDWQQEARELESIAQELDALAQTCEQVLEKTASLKDQDAVQDRLSEYSADLIRLPRAIQALNDFRRYLPRIKERSDKTRADLIKLRGGEDDAITSEEDRLLTSLSGIKDHVIEIIASLESTLETVRSGAAALLSLIGYHQPGFYDYAVQALRVVRIDIVSDVVHKEVLRVRALIEDIGALAKLQEHAQSLQ